MGKSQPLNRYKFLIQILLFAVITIFVGMVSISLGSLNISFPEILKILFGNSDNEKFNQVILQIRLPRVLFAMFVGGGLAITGSVFQAILMNPLAEPYILGISSGGTFGAVISILIGTSILGTQFLAFTGAVLVMFLVFYLGRKFGDINPNVLLLSGVMIGAFFSAAILLLIIFLNNSLRTAVYWMIGSLSFAKPDSLWFIIILVSVSATYLSLNSNKFNVLALGDETAKSLGINSSREKTTAYFISSIMIGSIVSVSGIIGFVGLTIPHLCRIILGVDNRIIIPISFFIGAIYLTVADTIARTIISPSELPVGAITALIGAPLFIYLLRHRTAFVE